MTVYIHGATYLDTSAKTERIQDIIIQDGTVTAMAATLPCPEGAEVIEAAGLYCTAGWIDSHVHLFSAPGSGGVSGNDMLKNGVTYVQEAGSAGCLNFVQYYDRDVAPSDMRVKSYIYLGPWGITPGAHPELTDLSIINYAASELLAKAYPDDIMGVKLRIDPRVCSDIMGALRMAKELGNRLGLPIIVHASRATESMEDILSVMGKDDIFAHIFANKTPGLLDADGKVKQCVWDAQARGVRFDLAHGNGNFGWDICKKAVAQGFLPDSISTDLHKGSLPKVKGLYLTMTKALACGMDLWQVLSKVTVESAAMLRLTDKQCTVEAGKPADLVLFRLVEEPIELNDADGVPATCTLQVKPVVTFLNEGIYRSEVE